MNGTAFNKVSIDNIYNWNQFRDDFYIHKIATKSCSNVPHAIFGPAIRQAADAVGGLEELKLLCAEVEKPLWNMKEEVNEKWRTLAVSDWGPTLNMFIGRLEEFISLFPHSLFGNFPAVAFHYFTKMMLVWQKRGIVPEFLRLPIVQWILRWYRSSDESAIMTKLRQVYEDSKDPVYDGGKASRFASNTLQRLMAFLVDVYLYLCMESFIFTPPIERLGPGPIMRYSFAFPRATTSDTPPGAPIYSSGESSSSSSPDSHFSLVSTVASWSTPSGTDWETEGYSDSDPIVEKTKSEDSSLVDPVSQSGTLLPQKTANTKKSLSAPSLRDSRNSIPSQERVADIQPKSSTHSLAPPTADQFSYTLRDAVTEAAKRPILSLSSFCAAVIPRVVDNRATSSKGPTAGAMQCPRSLDSASSTKRVEENRTTTSILPKDGRSSGVSGSDTVLDQILNGISSRDQLPRIGKRSETIAVSKAQPPTIREGFRRAATPKLSSVTPTSTKTVPTGSGFRRSSTTTKTSPFSSSDSLPKNKKKEPPSKISPSPVRRKESMLDSRSSVSKTAVQSNRMQLSTAKATYAAGRVGLGRKTAPFNPPPRSRSIVNKLIAKAKKSSNSKVSMSSAASDGLPSDAVEIAKRHKLPLKPWHRFIKCCLSTIEAKKTPIVDSPAPGTALSDEEGSLASLDSPDNSPKPLRHSSSSTSSNTPSLPSSASHSSKDRHNSLPPKSSLLKSNRRFVEKDRMGSCQKRVRTPVAARKTPSRYKSPRSDPSSLYALRPRSGPERLFDDWRVSPSPSDSDSDDLHDSSTPKKKKKKKPGKRTISNRFRLLDDDDVDCDSDTEREQAVQGSPVNTICERQRDSHSRGIAESRQIPAPASPPPHPSPVMEKKGSARATVCERDSRSRGMADSRPIPAAPTSPTLATPSPSARTVGGSVDANLDADCNNENDGSIQSSGKRIVSTKLAGSSQPLDPENGESVVKRETSSPEDAVATSTPLSNDAHSLVLHDSQQGPPRADQGEQPTADSSSSNPESSPVPVPVLIKTEDTEEGGEVVGSLAIPVSVSAEPLAVPTPVVAASSPIPTTTTTPPVIAPSPLIRPVVSVQSSASTLIKEEVEEEDECVCVGEVVNKDKNTRAVVKPEPVEIETTDVVDVLLQQQTASPCPSYIEFSDSDDDETPQEESVLTGNTDTNLLDAVKSEPAPVMPTPMGSCSNPSESLEVPSTTLVTSKRRIASDSLTETPSKKHCLPSNTVQDRKVELELVDEWSSSVDTMKADKKVSKLYKVLFLQLVSENRRLRASLGVDSSYQIDCSVPADFDDEFTSSLENFDVDPRLAMMYKLGIRELASEVRQLRTMVSARSVEK